MKATLLIAALYFAQLQTQNGSVTGQLLDAAGRPVAAARVAAAELPRGNAPESSTVLATITQTDSNGRYRLENVPPGRYYILAGLVDYPTYYPGVSARENASVVEITAGKSVAGLDFRLSSAKSAKLTGRLTGSAMLSSIPIALFSTVSSVLQTESGKDGLFEFDSVPVGSYVLRAPGFTPLNVRIDGKDLTLDLIPLYSGPGVRVSGKIIGKTSAWQPGITRTVTLSPAFLSAGIMGAVGTLGGALGITSGTALETVVREDGSFEFPAVPAGTYTLRSLPAAPGVASPRVEVGSEHIRGLEIRIPFQVDVAGRVLLDGLDGRSLAVDAVVEAHQDNFSAATSVRPDGTFRLRLTEGDNRISVARLSSEFEVKSIAYGLKEITGTALRIDSGSAPEEILVTVKRIAANSSQNDEREKAPFRGVHVGGRVSVVDAQGRAFPLMPANLSVTFKRPDGSGGSSAILADGTFGMPLPEELYMVSVDNVAAPYGVKSIFSGATDLLNQPLEVSSRALARIEVILEYKPAVTR